MDYERGFLEAAIDGEGNISIGRARYRSRKEYSFRVTVSFTNTNSEIVEKFKRIVEKAGGRCSIRKQTKQRKNWRQVYKATLYPNTLRRILPALDLVAKREQKKVALKALALLKENSQLTGYRGYSPIAKKYWYNREKEAKVKKNLQQLGKLHECMKELNKKGVNSISLSG